MFNSPKTRGRIQCVPFTHAFAQFGFDPGKKHTINFAASFTQRIRLKCLNNKEDIQKSGGLQTNSEEGGKVKKS